MSNRLPSALLRALIEEHGIEERSFLDEHENNVQLTSIRLNPLKKTDKFNAEEQVPWCKNGRYLKERPSFIGDPLFHAGCYYVQEASSMFLERALEQADLSVPVKVLDLCAAPGGKSTLIASLLHPESLLVSNEIIKSRVPVLSDNLTKWGALNCAVSNNDPRDFGRLEGYFDIMVVDAPCSGSGMFRKDPAAINEWSENNVQLCSERQQRILADAYPALKEGGLLIYSTCSYSSEENEQIADWLCDTYKLSSVRLPIEASWGIEETVSEKHACYGYRFYPHKVKGEGFFITCFRKQDGIEKDTPQLKLPKLNQNDVLAIEKWIASETLSLIPAKDGYCLIPSSLKNDILLLQSKLYLKKSGVYAGKFAGKDFIPDQELAQSNVLNNTVSRIGLAKEEALKYLRKDTLLIPDAKTGWALMCYEGFGLGWAKVLPNRINNYYPKELRILKEFN
ncbi:NOL1/NOP2/sun family putative RNA methylase [Arcticibacter tournemirensis]|uniref:RNA methyltransferase n=1 Tax=Arcticibacter tournemirensis TaxID=699437 RepID=A0A5M9GK05_9SPHI|nr:RNA methyltransferase [Arcticibacter tournemirensis]KAA8474640.1 RNA methyltransferase [Arcticibacter tournemirensis]TQM46780.1 NOL1/NOP2/sun family putative RNA methylase [Arcticibacter tournemirensis]